MSVSENTNQAQQESKPSDLEKNFATQRKYYEKQLEQERQARLQAEERAAQFEQERLAKSKPHQDDSDDDDNEPYVDKRSLKKHLERFSQNIDQKIDKKAEEKARMMVDQERQSAFLKQNPDFSQILNPELIQKFAEKHPEIADPMLEMPDNFARQKLLYQNIKALGLHKPPEAAKPSIQDAIDKNRRSPYYQPSSAAGAPPYANVGDFSPEGQKNAFKKMQGLINSRRAF